MIVIRPQTWIVCVEIEPRRHTLPCCATETLIIYSAWEGWRVGWRERKMGREREREIWREMWSSMAHSVSLPSSFFSSPHSSFTILKIFARPLLFSAPRLLLYSFFFPSLLLICDESHALPPSNLPQLPYCLSSSPPLLLSPPLLSSPGIDKQPDLDEIIATTEPPWCEEGGGEVVLL